MKKILFLLSLFTFSAILISAQNTISARIIDMETREGVEFAAISIKGKEIGTYTDYNGKFLLNGINKNDTLVIKHISYKKEIISLNAIKDSLITIVQEINSIQEVIIKPRKYKEYSIGYAKLGSKNSINNSKGVEITSLIRDKKYKDCFIKEITFQVKELKTRPFYIKTHIYYNKNGQPGDEVIFNNTHRIDDVKSIIKIDISANMISFPLEGFFIGIEWVGVIQNGIIDDNEKYNLSPNIKITDKNIESITFIRSWDRPWEDISNKLQGIPGIQSSRINALIGLTLTK